MVGAVVIRKSRIGKRTRSSRKGSAAIEFAFVALPFFMLLLGIFEIGILLLVNALVETASSDASRLVRTGQAQTQTLPTGLTDEEKEAFKISEFKRRFCAKLSPFDQNCLARTQIDVRVVQNFTQDLPDPLKDGETEGEFDPDVLEYADAAPGDFVLVRIWFEHPVVTPFMATALTRSNDKVVRLQTALAFRAEPYL